MAKHWYVVHVYSGFENKVASQIKAQVTQHGLSEEIEEILVPSESVVEIRRGKKQASEQKMFPGYVLVKMDLTDDGWHLIKSIPKVTGFLGSKTKPTPISDTEAERLINRAQASLSVPQTLVSFELGETVRVAEGPFAGFNGVVEEVDEDKGRIKVSVSIFGRSTPVDLEYSQVEKSAA